MELSARQFVSTGIIVAAIGQRTYVFVTVVDFTCTSLDHPQPAGYVIVEMEEVRIDGQTARLMNTSIMTYKHRNKFEVIT